jgi:preprotein translocase subunit SecB
MAEEVPPNGQAAPADPNAPQFAPQAVYVLTKGGFPPFLLPPVNFESLFNQAVVRQQQQQPGAAPAASVN